MMEAASFKNVYPLVIAPKAETTIAVLDFDSREAASTISVLSWPMKVFVAPA